MQNYSAASSASSYVNNNIKISQGKRLLGIVYTLVKMLAEERFCKYDDISVVEKRIHFTFSLEEINSFINFFQSKAWKESKCHNTNCKGFFYWPEVVLNFNNNEVGISNPKMPAKLISFIEGCTKPYKCNLVQVFNHFITNNSDAATKAEVIKFMMSNFNTDTLKEFYARSGKGISFEEFVYDMCSNCTKVDVVGNLDKFYDLYHDDMDFVSAIYDYYANKINKTKKVMSDDTIIILREEVYQSYKAGYWIFKVERW